MPDGVVKRNAARHIENHPQRIDNPACGKQPDAARRQDHRQLINLGVIFYVARRIPFNHAIWHLFVLGGSLCHFCAIYFYVR